MQVGTRSLALNRSYFQLDTPAVKPSRILCWKIMTTTTNGIVTTMQAARIAPQGYSCSSTPPNWEITTGTVELLLMVNVRANKNSFQAPMKTKSPVEIGPGIANGNEIRQK